MDSTKFVRGIPLFVWFVIDVFDLQKITAKTVRIERAESAGDLLNRVVRQRGNWLDRFHVHVAFHFHQWPASAGNQPAFRSRNHENGVRITSQKSTLGAD